MNLWQGWHCQDVQNFFLFWLLAMKETGYFVHKRVYSVSLSIEVLSVFCVWMFISFSRLENFSTIISSNRSLPFLLLVLHPTDSLVYLFIVLQNSWMLPSSMFLFIDIWMKYFLDLPFIPYILFCLLKSYGYVVSF